MAFTLEGKTYFSAAEIAREVRVSRQTIWRWQKDGKIPSGRRYRDHQVVFTSEEFETIREYAHRLEPIDGTPATQLHLFPRRRAQR